MTRHERRVIVILSACILAATFLITQADATPAKDALPCYSKNARSLIKCLNGQLRAGSNAYVLGVADCEGALAPSVGAKRERSGVRNGSAAGYVGPWSLLPDEYHSFIRQGPKWVDDIRRAHDRAGPDWTGRDLYSATLAVLSHGRKHGWGWSSCG